MPTNPTPASPPPTPAQLQPGQRAEESFGSSALARAPETMSVALAAQAKASVEARYIVAMRQPRDLMKARETLLADCRRESFAKAAIYRKPVGEGVTGPSIRLAEAAARALTNVLSEVAVIYDDQDKLIVRVTATDLEANVTYPMDVAIAKTIERSKPMEGRRIVSVRKNSRGFDVFTIEATDEEIIDKVRAQSSKAMRTCLLRLVPGDLLEDALEQCMKTRAGELSKDLPGARRKMVDAFAELDVTVGQLATHLGHPVDQATAAELDALRGTYNAIKDGESTWEEVSSEKREAAPPAPKSTAEANDLLRQKAEEVRARQAKQESERETPANAGYAPKGAPPQERPQPAKPGRSRRDTLLGDDDGPTDVGGH